MNLRPLCLCTFLLLSLEVGGAAPAAARGTVLSKCRILPIRPQNPGGTGTKGMDVSSTATAVQFESAGEWVTPEGTWDATLTLDPDLLQPEPPMALEEMPEHPGRGVFAGALEINTRLHLENRDTGETVDYGLDLGFSLAGPWDLDSPGESPTVSDLVYFTYRQDDPTAEPKDPEIVIPILELMKVDACSIRLYVMSLQRIPVRRKIRSIEPVSKTFTRLDRSGRTAAVRLQ